ncbi:FK506-binding protein 2 precursor, putative [Entamoeba dispar SAW760]|uniref:peptidylprolyl isomerase n=1 Tax=Entamoeba dispar (strain ATCC PRA-260 / SAW760) TaxID=370354 RepID=B0ER44_ENTDS|nr:FK506-binding protein 2 precursor, putative [Entamoeba dispar SAW760]EDR22997.1 FK506-binding protein 2 precursor, putative [Entamoeba dispar SAW760]|eukprot:EDR22997.1 FK506-binding protein 2 precursor, putative [Entamoeba dispar SAW760]
MKLIIIVLFFTLSYANRFYHISDEDALKTIRKVENGIEKLEIIVKKKQEQCEHHIEYGDYVSVHYNGTLQDGILFDTTTIKDEPFTFQIGIRQVIPGWEQGLLGKCENDELTLIIPPHLGYGSREVGIIPVNSILKFDIKIVKVISYFDAQFNKIRDDL